MNAIVAAVAGFLGGVLGSSLTSPRSHHRMGPGKGRELTRSADFTIILSRDPSNEVVSSTTPVGEARRGQQISWNVHDLSKSLADGDQVEIRFKDEAHGNPLDERRPKHNKKIRAKVRHNAEPRSYAYDVWLILQTGQERRLEDPDLDIVP
jgi:hypothetical protein